MHRNRGGGERSETRTRDMLQTDAAINPGTAGGPLVNLYGQVVGIAADSATDAQAIGFATPVNRLRDLLPALMDPVKTRGINVGFKLAERRSAGSGERIDAKIVLADNAARRIVAINGKPVRDIVDACGMLLALKPDEAIKLDFDDGTSQASVARLRPAGK